MLEVKRILYPALQVLDEQHLGVDAQFGGMDQRKLFIAAKAWLPRIGYKQRAHLINPLVPGLGEGGKMSSSDENSKIDLLDPPELVTKKIRKAVAVPRQTEGNALLSFIEYVLLPASGLKTGKPELTVDRSRDGLEPLVYHTVKEMNDDYQNDVLSPQILKPAVSKALNDLLAPVQAKFQASSEWQEITKKAYPPPPPVQKKVKEKKIGTGPKTSTLPDRTKKPDS